MIYTLSKKHIYIFIFSLLVSGGLGAIVPEIEKENEKSNTLGFELVDGLIVISATLNGTPGDYILDTGAPHLLINQKVRGPGFQLWSVGKEFKGKEIVVNHFSYGLVSKEEFGAWAADLTFVENIIKRPIAGIIGSDILAGNRVFIDFESGEITLLTNEKKNVYVHSDAYNITSLSFDHTMNKLPVVKVQVNNEMRKLAFDTGAAISVLGVTTTQHALDSNIQYNPVKMNQINIAQVPFLTISTAELNDSCDSRIDGILSVSSLNASKVLLDYHNSRIHMFWKKSS